MRHEFSTRTKKAAKLASGGVCMATGPVYGLLPGSRCTTILVAGNHDFDHYPRPAHVEGSDTVDNCMVVCKVHHLFKTRTFDIPAEAKIKRIQRKHGPKQDRRKPKKTIRSRGFDKAHRPMQGRPFDKRKTK